MAFGNHVGIQAEAGAFSLAGGEHYQGSVLVEIGAGPSPDSGSSPDSVYAAADAILARSGSWALAALSIKEPVFRIRALPEADAAEVPLAVLRRAFESPLSRVYPQTSSGATVAELPAKLPAENEAGTDAAVATLAASSRAAAGLRRSRDANPRGIKPLVVLPVFPGTNCEWDMERAFQEAGARTRLVIFRNRSREDIAESTGELAAAIAEAQMFALSGGFSAGDEPDGSGKFIANVLRAPAVADAVTGLLEKRDGLILGICNGFQALVKLGLVPYGAYRQADAAMPTLTFNRIGRHVSRMVRTRVMSKLSPWLALEEPGAVHILPVSHGEGRLAIGKEEGEALLKAGQAPFCYVDAEGRPALTEPDNPNGSDFAIEGLSSPDGRVLGKMGHSERRGTHVHVNIPGNREQRIFEAGVAYFT
jgi:phosphoribosylformylglycinamidine synthase